MVIIEHIRFRIKSGLTKLRKRYLRSLLKEKDFTIIASNCWGGGVYEYFGLPYTTPTVGLFFNAPCYIKFLRHLREAIIDEVRFVQFSKYEELNQSRVQNGQYYPIGILLNDIEIHFLHYDTEEEAREKWERRKKRINWDNLLLHFSDRDYCTPELITAFDQLPYKKVCFAAKEYGGTYSVIYLDAFKGQESVGDLYGTYKDVWQRKFNVIEWINK